MDINAQELVLNCLNEKKMSQTELAESMQVDRRNLNQKLHRQNDLKVNDFSDMLDHIGYSMEVVDNKGIRKVNPDEAHQILKEKEPKGLFWTISCGMYIGIDNSSDIPFLQRFRNKEECFSYLKDHSCNSANV